MIRPEIQKIIDDLKKGEGWKCDVNNLFSCFQKGNVKVYRIGSIFVNGNYIELNKEEEKLATDVIKNLFIKIDEEGQSELLKQIKL